MSECFIVTKKIEINKMFYCKTNVVDRRNAAEVSMTREIIASRCKVELMERKNLSIRSNTDSSNDQ